MAKAKLVRKPRKKETSRRSARGLPWHREYDDGWYATTNGQRVKLTYENGRPIKGPLSELNRNPMENWYR